MEKDLHWYLDRWRRLFSSPRELAWRDSWLVNGYCGDCRYCCGPQDSTIPFPMALLPSQIRPDLDRDFYLLDAQTACLDKRGCKALGEQGCSLIREQRPLACGLFPLVLANGALWLYQICPASLFVPLAEWMPLAYKAAIWLATLPERDLRCISIELDKTTLTDRYINLHITLFGGNAAQENR